MRRELKIVLTVLLLALPAFVEAAFIDINAANSTQLQTLTGIGPSKAAAIISYRTQHGPFSKIEDIQNVSGIGPSTFAGIKDFITVGEAAPASSPPATDPPPPAATSTAQIEATTTTEVVAPVGASGPAEYMPIPTLRLITGGDRSVSSGAETPFSTTVYDGKGNKRHDAIVTWTFGDGMRRTGVSVMHQYYAPGEYIVVVHASTPDGGEAVSEMLVTVRDASLAIAAVTPRGITLENRDARTLDLSFWRLSMGGQEFRIPEDTEILAQRSILFPVQIHELPLASTAALLYPSGEVAATYPAAPAPAPAQPTPAPARSQQIQEVAPIISQQTKAVPYAEEAVAPRATTELAALGAVAPEASTTPVKSPLRSPWTLGFLSLLVLAGGAFILL